MRITSKTAETKPSVENLAACEGLPVNFDAVNTWQFLNTFVNKYETKEWSSSSKRRTEDAKQRNKL